jgi:CDP-diacylglycerol--glycerol-3-phosphate 3-phosphatidyltransferase
MKNVPHSIPTILVIIRFALGPILWWSTYKNFSPWWFLAGFSIAFLTDIFDGIIARRYKIDTPALRTADSWVDTWFYIWIISAVLMNHSDSLKKFALPLGIFLTLQISEWIYGRYKFGRLTSYHAYSAKACAIVIFMAICALMLFNHNGILWWLAFGIGWINSIENWLLTISLNKWATDVKSIFHVWRSIRE